jgi:hypothetical protein
MAKTAATWRSMATICIRHKRLDVAEVCLGYMGNILAVRAIREAAALPEPDARLAAAAVYLGMMDEAERLYKGCGRYDLLNKLYISQGRMDKALETSQSRDRLHMRTILFHNARHKESCGDLDGSIKAYEQAGVHCKEVPRMLWEKKEKARLEEFVALHNMAFVRFVFVSLWHVQVLQGQQRPPTHQVVGTVLREPGSIRRCSGGLCAEQRCRSPGQSPCLAARVTVSVL